jgi:hypothetical protein
MPQPRSAVVLVIDRLGAGFLGPYGNTWLETPAFNRLASQAVLCEQMLAGATDLESAYRDYWQLPVVTSHDPRSLAQLAKQVGCQAVLVTDEEVVKQLPLAADFDECHYLAPAADGGEQAPAEDASLTAFAALLDVARDLLQTRAEPCLLWIHARGMSGLWDAPLELRGQFRDEEDPLPFDGVVPPEERAVGDFDPDRVLSVTHAYAGQVAAVDACLEAFWEALDTLPERDSVLLAVTSPRGYPLGEHGRIGPCDQALYSELLHVPCLVHLPGGEGNLTRLQELTQPVDLLATIAEGADWLEPVPTSHLNALLQSSLLHLVRGEAGKSRDLVTAQASGQELVRTAAWQLRVSQGEEEPTYELFAKPDDRWEFNDVASRCADIVTQLQEQARQPGGELPEELTSPWR